MGLFDSLNYCAAHLLGNQLNGQYKVEMTPTDKQYKNQA